MALRQRPTSGSLCALLCLLAVGPANAATLDAATGQELIEAMERAEARPGPDTIRLVGNGRYRFVNEYAERLALPPVTDDLRIDGHGSTLEWRGDASSGFFHVARDARLELRFMTVAESTATAINLDGELVLRGVRMLRNHATGSNGGALRISESGRARLVRTFFDSNIAAFAGIGSMCNDPSAIKGHGGGIFNAGRLRAVATTFIDNGTVRAINKTTPAPGTKFIQACSGNGGALFNEGSAVLINATMYRRRDRGVQSLFNLGSARLINASLSRVTLQERGQGETIVANSIVNGSGCEGIESAGHNVTVGECRLDHPTDQWLGPLPSSLKQRVAADGRVPVLKPPAGSPVLDSADPSRCPARDALGHRRPVDGDHDGTAHCDVGAVEFRPGPYPVDGRVAGLWYEPDRDGHYLLIERPAPGRLTAFWATYDGSGEPLWLYGSGRLDGDAVTIPLAAQQGMRFGIFDRAGLSVEPWGELELQFPNCRQLTMRWHVDGRSSLNGKAVMTRLTQVDGEECLP